MIENFFDDIADEVTVQSLKNFARNICFDEIPYVHGQELDLDWDCISTLFKTVHKTITSNSAQSIGLLTQHGSKIVPTNGGMILFGKDRLKAFPEAIIRCVRFLGFDKSAEVLDQADFIIYLPLALEEAIKFVRKNTRLGAKIGELRREDIPEYPHDAVRETIINAIVHADYSITGMYIFIFIFNDRIEVSNPGVLPFGLTMDEALAGSSRVRNRVIAKCFQHLTWVEQWGSGLHRIISSCVKRGLKKPLFEEVGNRFKVTLYSIEEHEVVLEPEQHELIEHIVARKKNISTKDAAQFWNVTPRTARNRLIKLVDIGMIKKIGTSEKDPKGVYALAKNV